MSEKRFTPGPWRLGRVGSVVSDSPVEGMGGSDAIEYYGGHCVCESVVEPNAHLIAAAPDLYDALRSLLLSLNDVLSPDFSRALENSHAVLAKARGEA